MRRHRLLRWGVALFGGLLLTASALPAQTTREKYEAKLRAKSEFNLGASSQFTYNVNNWLCGLDQGGEACTNTFGSTTGGGGFWPLGTGNQYVFQMGMQAAARDPLDPTKFVAMHCFNVSATNAACKPRAQIFSSDNATDMANWPETCKLYNPQTGELVNALSQLDTCARYWDGDPAGTVPGGHPMGLEVVQHTLAFTLEGFRDMIFFINKVKNISNDPLFRQANPNLNIPAGGWVLQDLYLAFGSDHDVSFDHSGTNFGTFVPFLNPSTPLFLAATWEASFDAPDFNPYPQCGFCTVPGFVGTTFLRSPYNTTGQPITTNTAGVIRTVPPITREELEPLRLAAAKGDTAAQNRLRTHEVGQSFGSIYDRSGTGLPDPNEAGQSWRYYSGNLTAIERAQAFSAPPGFGFVDQATPADTRQFHATGPLRLEPGDSADVIVGLVVGAPVLDVPGFSPGTLTPHGLPGDTNRIIEKIMGRGRTNTAYPSLFKAVIDARQLFETNFLLPTPPPSPIVTAIPGDRQVAVQWSAEAVTTPDPYFPVAQQRGIPGYREQDFEGYRVYRKVRPNAPWELIAQYDLRNGLNAVVTPTNVVTTAEGVEVVVTADTVNFCVPRFETDRDAVSCAPETGLRFSLIDRGGTFPDPSNGPGLLNGVRYYYTVTTFDINSPFAPGGSSLEAGKRLSGELQSVGGASAVPRANAPNFTAGSFTTRYIGTGGTALDLSASMPAIDPETGQFAGPIPPTNGFNVAVEPFIPALVTSGGTATVTIDSITPGNPFSGQAAIYHITAETPAGTQQIDIPLTIGYFGDVTRNETAAGFDLVRASAEFAEARGIEADPVVLSGLITLAAPDNYFNAQIGRGWVNGATGDAGIGASIHNGPRWFVSSAGEPADPNGGAGWFACAGFGQCDFIPGGLLAGDIPGYRVFVGKGYLTMPTIHSRSLEAVYSTVRRAADIEVTWGANGAVESVIDLTHGVPVPFHPDIRASWGFLTPASFNGVTASLTRDGNNNLITMSDFTCLAPYNEFVLASEVENAAASCRSPVPAKLQQTAAIVQLDSTWAGGTATGNAAGSAAGAGPGFAMYINGENFLFRGSSLPAAGAKWTLRTYVGMVHAVGTPEENSTDVAEYEFDPVVRPPNVPGLKAEISLTPTVVDATTRTVAEVHTVPDPFIVSSALQTNSASRHILFVNLPDQATVRIYSLSGVLVDAFEHADATGGGSAEWDLRNRNNQFVSSGVYFFHVQTPDGKTKIGKFTVIQAP